MSKLLEICWAVPCMWLTVLYYTLKTSLRVNLLNVLVTIKTNKTSNKNKKATLQFICFAGERLLVTMQRSLKGRGVCGSKSHFCCLLVLNPEKSNLVAVEFFNL